MDVTKPRYKVTVRRDPDDARYWLVNVVDQPGAHTFGRSLGEAKRNAVEMVALWSALEPDAFDTDWDIQLPAEWASAVEQARVAMARAEEDQRRRDEAVRALTAAGVSYRDIAELLGLSFQRVAQIAKAS